MLSMETLGNQGTGMSDDIHVVSRGRLVDYLNLPSRGLHFRMSNTFRMRNTI